MKSVEPPRFILRFLEWFCKPEYHADIEGDLLEIYDRRVEHWGRNRANLHLCKDVLFLFRPGIIRSAKIHQPLTSNGMIKSYFLMGWRNLWKNKLYSTLNVLGLTFGMVCFLLIGLYVYDELNFDTQHSNAERIYRVITHEKSPNNEATTVAAAGYMVAEDPTQTFANVERTTRMQRIGRANLVDPENPVNVQEAITVADEYLLQVFDFPLLEGDRRTALKEPNSIAITEELAMRIFGRTDVINKNLQFSHMDNPVKITAILKNHPKNSSFTFTSVLSESTRYSNEEFMREALSDWTSQNYTVYALLKPDANADSVSSKITRLVHANVTLEPGTKLSYNLQPLKDVHLKSDGIIDGARNANVDPIPQGNPVYVTVFLFTAILVLLIAGINYSNLTTARASSRLKEIGVRKVIGAVPGNLIGQFLVESFITIVIAFGVAVLIVAVLLPSFNEFANKKFLLFSSVGLGFWAAAAGLIIAMGLLSGGYAALLLSYFKPVSLLKGLVLKSGSDFSVRKALVVLQFTISTVMIIGTIVLFRQVHFLNESNLGFNKDLMVVIDVNVGKARSNFDWVKNEMSKIAAVEQVTVTSHVPGDWKTLVRVKLKKEGGSDQLHTAYVIGADKDFLATYGIELLKGRNFGNKNDTSAVLINEAAAKILGITHVSNEAVEIPQSARGSSFAPVYDDINASFKPRVVGIVKDFHFQSLRAKIEPLIIAYHDNPIYPIDYYSVKIQPQNIQATLEKLKAVMVANDEREPFEYHFLDEQLARFYIEDQRSQTILGWVALASVVIACLGLFGLATYSAQQRLKEIGVRKVLGANLLSIMALLSKDFVKLVLIACCFAFPVAWFGANWWLQEYAYHIDAEWWIFALAGVITTGIALLTVSYQAIKAALMTPVKTLRSE
ncbi:ABC transporter permease [Dyadobacter chenwenxiniae]|uniref:ABC transporter permease n=1 Tax=Dyadobacter chenwenxiniae TaxID=2906456 RepID=A0A9X1TI58_9BACT|nr:ABC transporter permease [Dyadobacter chenwenxiniae]MCF0065817.1 ABC transporter permease [Dyadobacter chenwenxiniae]UON84029.1 ABC transporter permease [Dyadobacter chenwenxiniae]